MAYDRGHAHLIYLFMHACGYYSRAATISFAELQVRLLFKRGYYSGCGFYSNKYSSSHTMPVCSHVIYISEGLRIFTTVSLRIALYQLLKAPLE